jgi:ribonuclease HI
MSNSKKRYYAVKNGRRPGIYDKWYGEDGAEAQIKGFSNAHFKKFTLKSEAKKFLEAKDSPNLSSHSTNVIIYTDGGCINNPGPGGYGVVLKNAKERKELSGGFRLTTNNRMELMACIVGLKALKRKLSVVIYSDSKYVVDGISKGWAKRWKSNGWMRNKYDRAENVDLWEQLLELCEKHKVQFRWVKGHAGNPENERCDQLAKQAALKRGLPPDVAYSNS